MPKMYFEQYVLWYAVEYKDSIEISNPGLDRSKLFQDAVTVPMSNALQ